MSIESQNPNQASQGVPTLAIVSVIAGIASFLFVQAPESWWHRMAIPAALLAMGSGSCVLKCGPNGAKLGLTGLILGTISLCIKLIISGMGLAFVGSLLIAEGFRQYRSR
jgi:hypothetical protein